MDPAPQNIRLVERAYWLIKLRWIAVAGVGLATFLADIVLPSMRDFALYALYGIAILLALYNATVLLLLKRLTRSLKKTPVPVVKKLINVQISADLLILTVLLHFSGGIENPFIFFFIFHMVIASILLSVRESYLQATFAVVIFGLLILLEYLELECFSHHCLTGFVTHCLRRDGRYIFGTYFVFVITLYLVVYMASHIARRLRKAEQAHRQANILLQEKDHIKDEYVLRVTHDIKGHLATIQSCLGVIVKRLVGPLDDQQADFINRAHSRTIKLSKFVRTLLKLTQMRLSNELEMDVFSLGDAVHSVVAGVKSKADDKQIALSCNVESSEDKIFGNQFSIEEVIANLLLNAIKYTPANGTVGVNLKDGEDGMLVEISDTGIGIPQEEQSKIFREFYRATNAREIERDGTGLGLSIVKHIVERHGGKIQVESKEGCGTTFHLTLPKNRDDGK
ncbi:MAG: sensor histidine kinase [Planctomycetota bacterium]|jgi:signal transduction histidine kinase